MLSTRITALTVVALTLSACRSVTTERIASWRGTSEGREKLVQVLRDGSVPVDRRAEAAAALTQVGWVDRVESAVAGLPFDERARLIPAIVPLLAGDLAADGPAGAEARETLFALRRQSTTDEGTRSVDSQLLPALERDLRADRKTTGHHSAKEMLIAIGPAATPLVARVLADGKTPFEDATAVLDKVGDRAAHEASGAALVARVRAGQPLSPPLWQALGTLGGPQVVAFLQESIEKGGDDADHAARTLVQVRRDRALLPFALKIAADARVRPVVREQMLTLATTLGGDEARTGLVAIIGKEADPTFRFRIFETLVKGDAKAILPALEAFPTKESYDAAAVHEHLVGPLVGMGWPAREGIFKGLKSPSALARMTAVWSLERVGFASDAPQLTKLTTDRAKVKGLTPTVGSEALRVEDVLKKQKT
jgi:hypothetical protein